MLESIGGVVLGGLIVAPGAYMLLALSENAVIYTMYAAFGVIGLFLLSVALGNE